MPEFRILNLADAPVTPMKGDRGTQLRLINADIGAGQKHSLTNVSDEPFEIFEVYTPAGDQFDFVVDD
jgi:hypothetical protein